MYRVRFHGRGGQGMKTASRILGTALFISGYEVQDAPRYGAERRGAPIFAYVRASREAIHERGVIGTPDLVVVSDDTLVGVPNAGVFAGLDKKTVLLIVSELDAETWRERTNLAGPILTLPGVADDDERHPLVGAVCVGAAARLLGTVDRKMLESAIREELAGFDQQVIAANLSTALDAFDRLEAQSGIVSEGEACPEAAAGTEWIDLAVESVRDSAPAVFSAANSVEIRTGLWRTLRPVIDYERCNRCNWICSTFCPDNAIKVDPDGTPRIDLDHCKGCMICVAQCPPHAIEAVPEAGADAQEESPAGGAS